MARSAYSEVIELLLDRMKNLSKGINITRNKDNKLRIQAFNVVAPDPIPTAFSRVDFEATSASEVKIINYADKAESKHDFSAGNYDFVGYEVSLADGVSLTVGDKFTLVNNNSTISFNEVRAYKRAASNSMHPFIEIYPSMFSNTEITVGRTRTTNTIDIDAQIDIDKIGLDDDMTLVLDVAADIENEIMRDPRFDCKVIDSMITKISPYVATNTSEIIGVVVTTEIKSKHLLADASALSG